jgi:tetratricopeptide (TPR) repeat protein
MADDLRRFQNGEPILARPISQVERAWRWCRRNPLIAAPSALAVTLLLATAIIASWSASIIADERDEANKQKSLAVVNANKAEKEKAEAEKQRLLADEAKLQAEKNQKLAEKQALLALQNIQLVVTEVDDRLAKEPGMSPIRIGMLEVLEKQWDALDVALAGGIQGEAIPTLMAVRSKIADAWSSVDRIKEANAQYEVIYKQAKERLLVKNRSDASRSNLALICVRWAPIRQRLSGDPSEAEKLLHESNELLREILADPRPEPNSPKMFQIADTLQQSLMRAAAMNVKKGALDKAKDQYQEIEKICSKVLDEINQSADWYSQMPEERKTLVKSYFQQNRDLSLAGQANILCRIGKSEDAIPIYDRVIEGRKENVEQKPTDRNARDQLALQLRNYGQNMMRLGRAEDAVRLIGQAHDWTEKNFSEDPTNAAFKRSHGHSLYYLGVARDAVGQTSDSIVLFERSRALRQEMVAASPDQSNKVNLMLSEARLGKREAGEALIAELSASPAKDPDLRLDLARALAQLYRNNKDNDAGPEFLEKSLTAIERAIEDGLADSFSITSEQDLAPLRENPKFISLTKKIKFASTQ